MATHNKTNQKEKGAKTKTRKRRRKTNRMRRNRRRKRKLKNNTEKDTEEATESEDKTKRKRKQHRNVKTVRGTRRGTRIGRLKQRGIGTGSCYYWPFGDRFFFTGVRPLTLGGGSGGVRTHFGSIERWEFEGLGCTLWNIGYRFYTYTELIVFERCLF